MDENPTSTKCEFSVLWHTTWVPKEKRGKLDPKSEKNIMVGYTMNGYRVWDPRKRKITIARDVVFNEQPGPDATPISSKQVLYRNVSIDYQPEADEPKADEPEAKQPEVGQPEDNHPVDGQPEDAAREDCMTSDVNGEADPALPSQLERANSPGEVSTRRSGRERKIPGKLFDFITGFRASTAVECSTGNFEDHDDSMLAFALNAESFVEDLPTTIDGLRRRSDWHHWKEAINSELKSLRKNETWELVPKSQEKNIVDCKWVFKIKRDEAGNVDRYKARLVAKGYSQSKGYDYDETYAPVAKGTTVRVLLAVANQMGYYMHQMDVKTAFLNGQLKEEIFMQQPEGFKRSDPGLVCRLKKSIYGLKQAPRSWNSELHNFILQLGFQRSNLDSCLYWRKEKKYVVYLLLYVDDIILVSNCLDVIAAIKKKLSAKIRNDRCW